MRYAHQDVFSSCKSFWYFARAVSATTSFTGILKVSTYILGHSGRLRTGEEGRSIIHREQCIACSSLQRPVLWPLGLPHSLDKNSSHEKRQIHACTLIMSEGMSVRRMPLFPSACTDAFFGCKKYISAYYQLYLL